MKRLTAWVLTLVAILGLVGCSQQGQQDIITPTESGKNTEIVESNNSIPHFSFAEDAAIYVEGEPGVKTSGFVNTTETEITFENVAERAKNECTVEYNSVTTYFDTDECVWKVHFCTDGMVGGDQSVYLDCDGKTLLIVYGE